MSVWLSTPFSARNGLGCLRLFRKMWVCRGLLVGPTYVIRWTEVVQCEFIFHCVMVILGSMRMYSCNYVRLNVNCDSLRLCVILVSTDRYSSQSNLQYHFNNNTCIHHIVRLQFYKAPFLSSFCLPHSVGTLSSGIQPWDSL